MVVVCIDIPEDLYRRAVEALKHLDVKNIEELLITALEEYLDEVESVTMVLEEEE